MSQHAKLMSPSGAAKWMTCPGAPAMEYDRPDTSSAYADEGTAAHFLGSECLSGGDHPATHIGRKILVGTSFVSEFDGAVWADREDTPADWRTRETYEVDMDMVAAVNTYVQGVRRMAPGVALDVEVRLPLTPVTGERGAFGTADCAALVAFDDDTGFGTELQVHDLKYGRGVAVEAKDNEQLMIYALAYIADREVTPDRVRLVIHMPRKFDEASEWVVSADEMADFAARVTNQAAAVMLAFEYRANWIGKDNAYLVASEDACRWCKAKAVCPALTAAVEETVGTDLALFADLTTVEVESIPDACSDEALGVKMQACDLLEGFISAVRGEVERRLLDKGNSEEVRNALGYKLVPGKKGARAWADEAKAEEVLKSMRLKQEEMYSFKVITPTAAEMIFGEKGSAPSTKRWNKLQEFITQKDGAPHVAELGDKRAPLVLDKSAGFEDETGGDLA